MTSTPPVEPVPALVSRYRQIHTDENSNLAQYQRTLDNILIDRPDFHIDLGDTFMTEKHTGPFDPVVKMATSQTMVDTRYIYERQHFGRITHSTPLFANGNHEGELGWLNDGTANNLAVGQSRAAKFYANPMPTSFTAAIPAIQIFWAIVPHGMPGKWVTHLCSLLDPYWNTKNTSEQGCMEYEFRLHTISMAQ